MPGENGKYEERSVPLENMRKDATWAKLIDEGFEFSQQCIKARQSVIQKKLEADGYEVRVATAYKYGDPTCDERRELEKDYVALFVKRREIK